MPAAAALVRGALGLRRRTLERVAENPFLAPWRLPRPVTQGRAGGHPQATNGKTRNPGTEENLDSGVEW